MRLTAQLRREKWFNIGGNRSIVTRYRLDSQFHCSYLESRGVPKKSGKYRVKKPREMISLSFPETVFEFGFCTMEYVVFSCTQGKKGGGTDILDLICVLNISLLC
jgi:hypothetical protein